jgi:hypothetical protein
VIGTDEHLHAGNDPVPHRRRPQYLCPVISDTSNISITSRYVPCEK